MNTYVIDASISVKWFTDAELEPDSPLADEVLRAIAAQEIRTVQPAHWPAEVLAALARLQPELAPQLANLLSILELPIETEIEDYELATQLAVNLKHHFFDTLYHAIALNRGACLLTADRRYFRKAKRRGSIALLEDWTTLQA